MRQKDPWQAIYAYPICVLQIVDLSSGLCHISIDPPTSRHNPATATTAHENLFYCVVIFFHLILNLRFT
jgi:hypothetical protein